MGRARSCAIVLTFISIWPAVFALAQQQVPATAPPPPPPAQPASESTPATEPLAKQTQIARIWANEPPLMRLARDKFGAELTETDAKFFAAVASNDWADFRTSAESTFNPEEPSSWNGCPVLKADRLIWLCTDAAATKLVPSRGIWLRGVNIEGKVDLYRSEIPFSLTFYDCLMGDGLNIAHAKMQELDIRNSCLVGLQARGVEIAENVYLLTTSVYGGLDFIDAQIGGDFDFSGGLAFHGTTPDDVPKPGVALNMHDAKVSGDIKLNEKFRALGQVRLIGTQIGRSLSCGNSQFSGNGELALDIRRSQIGANLSFTGSFRAEGGVEMRRTRIGGDFDCDGGRFIASGTDAVSADLVDVGGQVHLGDGFHAEGEVRLINAHVGGDIDCDNGHFLHPDGDALSLDGAIIGRSLRIGADTTSPTEEGSDLPAGFLSRGTLRMWGTQVGQDILASGAQFETPAGTAVLACNLRVASRVVLSGITAKGTVNLFSADVEHELDLRGSTFDGREAPGKVAIWANAMQVRGHVYSNRVESGEQVWPFRVDGLMSLQFASIKMHWDLFGAQLVNHDGDTLDASDCRVGGYVNLDHVAIDGRASFSRAKIDGMWILNKVEHPENFRLDMRFAHIWVIKDEKLDDWPPAGQLQLEGLVYDHFDDDSPLDVNDRLAWLRRQYAPAHAHIDEVRLGSPTDVQPGSAQEVRRGSPDPAAAADRRSPFTRDRYATETFGQPPERGQETLAQHVATRAQKTGDGQPPVVAADFEVVPGMPAPQSTPAPMMAAPIDHPPAPMPVPPPEEAEGMTARTGDTSSTDATTTTDAAEATTTQSATDEKAAATSTAQSQPPAVAAPDPAGRRYITQPYTQLAAVYRAIGQDEQASTVLVARAERLGELAPAFSAQGLWYRYLGRLIGYGYEPFRAIKIGAVIIAIGAIIFALGARRNLMAETKLAEAVLSREGELGTVSPTYPRFNALVYSLDVFLPFVDLNQVCYWIPGEKPAKPRTSRNCLMHIGPYSLKVSAVLHAYLWFQTLAGWTLCTLLAAAVTGIVQS